MRLSARTLYSKRTSPIRDTKSWKLICKSLRHCSRATYLLCFVFLKHRVPSTCRDVCYFAQTAAALAICLVLAETTRNVASSRPSHGYDEGPGVSLLLKMSRAVTVRLLSVQFRILCVSKTPTARNVPLRAVALLQTAQWAAFRRKPLRSKCSSSRTPVCSVCRYWRWTVTVKMSDVGEN
jgi:hypothetical protein